MKNWVQLNMINILFLCSQFAIKQHQFLTSMCSYYFFSFCRPSTGASMNPVRTLGPALVTGNYNRMWIYIIAPILGAMFGTSAYEFLKLA
jgi:glycerol uptake facilitator-like aquaporin